MATEKFDLIVIGSGPAGYVGAIRAAQLGFKVACIEKDKTLGGTCLNVGCIPSKALLESSEHFYQAKTKFSKHGIQVEGLKLDLPTLLKRKEGVVRQLTNGIAGLYKKNKIEWVPGLGAFKGREGADVLVEANNDGAKRMLQAPRVLICTGSTPAQLPFLPFDGDRVVSSTEALSFSEVPGHLVVVGGGVIGLELGSVWARLGSRVTVIEFMDRICPVVDQQIGKELFKALQKQGIEFRLSTKCLGATRQGKGMVVQTEEIATGNKSAIECDRILVATGRKPNTQGLGLEAIGLTTDKQGRIEVDAHYLTKAPGVYAVGDVIAGPMLAHKAEEEAVAATEIMAGQAGHVNYDAIPNVIYTWPELASVGATEEELKAKGIAYKIGTFPFMANGRAKSMEETEGLAKIIADAKTDRVLGVHIVGPRASDMIAEAVTTMEFGGSAEDIARTCHAHPTLSEVLKQAALGVDKRTIEM
jgi:dihydrolipoamide dehydrogenase